MNREYGKCVWFFPDGDLPPAGDGILKGHESIIILNPNKNTAKSTLTLYFEESDPVVIDPSFEILPERVICIRMDNSEQLGGFKVPLETQYAIKVESDNPVIVQYGRLDTRQENMAYYTTMGFSV
ncbi:MAG: sensory rhodopsin transducer [Clostridia bacterium]|nr:sensory rhodopsin transducer [Clostridia bacterium]